MKRKLKAVLAVSLAAMAFQAHAEDKIKLGFIAALSGPLGVLGTEQQRGLDLALEHLNNRLGNREVELYTADSRAVPGVAVQEISKLVDKEGVDVITGGSASNVIMAMVKPIQAAGLTLLGTNGGPSPLAGKDCTPSYYSIAFQNDQWSEAMGHYMNKQGIKSAYFIGTDFQAGWDHVGGAERTFEGENLGKIFTPQAQLDFSAELAQIRAAQPDGVFAFYPGGAAVAFLKQYGQSGLNIPLFSSGGVDTQFLPAFDDAAIGAMFVSHYNAGLENEANKRFVEDFTKEFGRKPSLYAASQYDAIMLLDKVVAQLPPGKIDRKKLQALIGTTSFASVRGDFKFNHNNMPIQNIYAQRIEKGEDGKLALNLIGVAAENVGDRFAAQCPMGK
ncbi:MAG: ABC transporter substrate-binding protein [Pusillimonas sp.]|nr:ABC transporter substrate-binding protein [Pusillimonas sp.]